jgi:hypothetical protein
MGFMRLSGGWVSFMGRRGDFEGWEEESWAFVDRGVKGLGGICLQITMYMRY